MSSQIDRGPGRAAILAALFCLVLTAVRAIPPTPAEPTSDGSFSAVTAQKILEDLYSDETRHHIGTQNNRILKERILDHLREIGYEPSLQSTMACWESGGCGFVENILARLEGKRTGKAVLLAVHYDGVGAGPSVSDDGVAVAATLEIARILKSGPQLDNDIIFLIDDGEEAFLLGAAAFAAKHPWAKDVGAVVNLEARGSGGRSYMFETGKDNAWLIELMKKNIPRPTSSSLFYSVYQTLPNDTDFTVFKSHGMNGLNFAFIQDVVHYHTPLDNLAHVTPASLQHHGDNALGMVRALANADLASPPQGTASWFDIWGFGILAWPETWNLPAAVISLLLFLGVAAVRSRQGDLTVAQIRSGMALYLAALFSAILLSLIATWVLTTLGRLPGWPAAGWAPKTAFWLIGIASGTLWIGLLGRRAGTLATWLGALFWLATLALVFSVLLPGGAYLFLAPALVGTTLTALTTNREALWAHRATVILTVTAACAAQLVMAWSLWDAMGITIMPVVTFFVAAVSTLTLAPSAEALGRTSRSASLVGFAAAALMIVVSLVLPAYSDESPRALNFYFVQDADSGRARLAVRPRRRELPDSLIAAVDWNEELERLYPWDESEPQFLAAEVDPIPVAPPGIEVLERRESANESRIHARFFSPRRAARGALVFRQPQRIKSLRLEEWDIDLNTEEVRSWNPDGRRVVRFATMPAAGIEFELTVTGTEPFEVYGVDYSFDLPPAGDPLTLARPSDVVPIGQGDLTIVHVGTKL